MGTHQAYQLSLFLFAGMVDAIELAKLGCAKCILYAVDLFLTKEQAHKIKGGFHEQGPKR